MLRAVRFGGAAGRRFGMLVVLLGTLAGAVFAGQVADLSRDGVGITVDADPETVDVGRDFFVTVTVTSPPKKVIRMPDLRDRFEGFQVAEDFDEEPKMDAEWRTTRVVHWRLVPDPLAKRYRLAPFVLAVSDPETADAPTLYTRPVQFTPPAARATEEGDMEIAPTRDLPPLSWRLVGICAAVLAGLAALAAVVYLIVRKIRLMVRIHRMSPIERALYELEELLKKGLDKDGRQKDFYVELTQVVRRYIGRQHGVRAPNLTTEEFFDITRNAPTFPKSTLDKLIDFLRRADMVKFAGVESTPEMIELAKDSARSYLVSDNEIVERRRAEARRRRD